MTMKWNIPDWLIITAGAGQIFTAMIYPYVRHKVFDWYNDIRKLKPLNQEIVKTYGHYIQGLNAGFGTISICLPGDLKNQTALALSMTGLIAAYWIGKLITQFAYYPMYQIPDKWIFKIGELGMNMLFILFASVFTALFVSNLAGLYAG